MIENIKNYKSVFLLGCSECAALCGTGGEPEVKAMKETLESEGKEVTGTFVAKSGCQVLGTKLELKPYKEAINKADCIIVMSCGAGTQTLTPLRYPVKIVCSATNYYDHLREMGIHDFDKARYRPQFFLKMMSM